MYDLDLFKKIIYWRLFKCKSYIRERKAWIQKSKYY